MRYFGIGIITLTLLITGCGLLTIEAARSEAVSSSPKHSVPQPRESGIQPEDLLESSDKPTGEPLNARK